MTKNEFLDMARAMNLSGEYDLYLSESSYKELCDDLLAARVPVIRVKDLALYLVPCNPWRLPNGQVAICTAIDRSSHEAKVYVFDNRGTFIRQLYAPLLYSAAVYPDKIRAELEKEAVRLALEYLIGMGGKV